MTEQQESKENKNDPLLLFYRYRKSNMMGEQTPAQHVPPALPGGGMSEYTTRTFKTDRKNVQEQALSTRSQETRSKVQALQRSLRDNPAYENGMEDA